MINAAITKKIAARITLAGCIPHASHRLLLIVSLPSIVPSTPRIGPRNPPGVRAPVYERPDGSSMIEVMEEEIRPGRLLVATPLLEEPSFRRSVVFVVDHGPEEGTLGVVLNRPTEVPVGQILPPWADLVSGLDVVFHGGPVALDSALALAHARGTDEPFGWRSLDGLPAVARVGLVDLDSPPSLIADGIDRLRVFAGYAGWAAGQLRTEIEEGSWYVVSAELNDIFAEAPERLWQRVLRRQGGDLAFVSTYPDDPTLN